MAVINMRVTIQDGETLFTLGLKRGKYVVEALRKAFEMAGRTDLLNAPASPWVVMVGHESVSQMKMQPGWWRRRFLLPRMEAAAQMLTGMSSEMLEEFGGVDAVWGNVDEREGKLLYRWDEIKGKSLLKDAS